MDAENPVAPTVFAAGGVFCIGLTASAPER
jgi:hypothetical protein